MKAKGDKKTGGRKKGVPNKTTQTQREFLIKLVDGQRAQIKKDLKSLEPKDRLMIIEKFMSYILPKLQSATIATSIDEIIKQIEKEE